MAKEVQRGLLADGNWLRSSFLYLGWPCGAQPDPAALRAAAGLEFLHAFALLQGDVMDGSALRRGRPSGPRTLEQLHRHRELPGAPSNFGESAAVLLGDLCPVWADQMPRESELDATALARARPRRHTMRTELAVGQLPDLVNDAARFPSLGDTLDIAGRKSGNYTGRHPLEIGASSAGCDDRVLTGLGGYGRAAVGEAFQLRDELLGVFGAPATTGKPAGIDLAARNATAVVVAADQLADAAQVRELGRLMTTDHVSPADIGLGQTLIAEMGTVDWIEQSIDQRLTCALDSLDTAALDSDAHPALICMAAACIERVT